MTLTTRWAGWMGWLLLSASLALCFMTLPAFISSLTEVLAHTQLSGVDQRLMNVKPEKQAWLLEQAGGRWGQHGWYLTAGEKGHLRIVLPGTEAGTLKLRLWLFSPGYLSVSIKEGSGYEEIPLHELDGRLLQIQVHGPSELVVVSSNELSQEQLVLDRYAAAWFPPESHLPSLWPLALIMAFVFGGWACLLDQHKPWITVLSTGGIILAVMIGFVLRWQLFDIARGLPADPDAASYFAFARNFTWFSPDHGFYSGNFNEREPLHIAALSLWLHLWGPNVPAMKLYTVCVSTLLILTSGLFIWTLSGRWFLGVAASWIITVNPAWIDESVRGLRLESISLLLLTVLSVWIWTKGWLGALLMGVLSGCMALVQSTAIGIVLPLIGFGWLINVYRDWRRQPRLSPTQWKWFHLAAASMVASLLYVPHLYGIYVVHGDLSWPSYGYARWNANIEFPQRIGTAGFPSREEFQQDTYAGPRITYAEYLFGLHTIPQLLYGQLKGWVESIVYMSVSSTPRLKSLVFLQQASGISAVLRHLTGSTVIVFVFFLLFTMIGWVDLWHRAAYWWVPFLSLWGIWHAAFLYSVRVIEPFRHTAHVYPLLLFCFLWGGFQIIQRLQNMSVKI